MEVWPHLQKEGDKRAPGVCWVGQLTMQCPFKTRVSVGMIGIEHESVEPTVPCLVFY